MDTPDARQLHTVVGGIEIVVLEEALVEQLERPGGGVVRRIAIVGDTSQGCLLIAAGTGTQTTVVLDMGGEGQFLEEVELAGDLRIGAEGLLAAEIDINEIVPRAPVVGLELFEGDGHLLTGRLLIRVDVTTEVIVELDVLGTGRKGRKDENGKED